MNGATALERGARVFIGERNFFAFAIDARPPKALVEELKLRRVALAARLRAWGSPEVFDARTDRTLIDDNPCSG